MKKQEFFGCDGIFGTLQLKPNISSQERVQQNSDNIAVY